MADGDPGEGAPASIEVVDDIRRLGAADWDACAGTGNPFLAHAFLSALEESGSATARTGWLPQHLVLRDGAGRIVGCAPCYLKSHSLGEYVFDHGWADAYERAGGRYYPKLQVCVPFTPVAGPRLLARPGPGAEACRLALMAGLESLARRHKASSVHVTFPTEAEWTAFGQAGWLQRTGQQYHWENHGYASFEAFLAALSARKRKAIRKERRDVAESGVRLSIVTGRDLTEAHWDAFFGFYMDTGGRKWGRPYLTRRFFSLVGERMADRIALVVAEHGGRPVAGALNFIGADTLYGRNWGCEERVRFLHFEACYYQAIEFAITRGLARVEAGAQGEHKIQRGYLPVKTFSAHFIRDPALSRAVADYLERERAMVDHEVAALGEYSPFRREDDSTPPNPVKERT
jgi:predicted N-acyltransferase